MKKYYFTFGGFNAPELKDYCVNIESETPNEARNIMFKTFGSKWCFMYDEEKPLEKEINFNIAKNIHNNYNKY